jgi:hypothetical protein
LRGTNLFNILKNLFNGDKNEVNCDERDIDQIDNNIDKVEKHIAPEANKISKREFDKDLKLSLDDIDTFKVNKHSPLKEEVAENIKFSSMNQELFYLMKDQLKEKDLQICKLSEILNQEQDLHKNTQILFKQEQSKQEVALPKDDLNEQHEKVKNKAFLGIRLKNTNK